MLTYYIISALLRFVKFHFLANVILLVVESK